MSPARKLLDDLVSKRLWPIALLLVVALVAVPVVIGGSSEPAGSPDVAAIADPASIESAATAVDLVGPPEVRSRPGAVRDPFRRTKRKPASKGSAKKASSSNSAAPSKSSTSSKPGSGSSSSSGSGTPSPAKPKPAVTVPVAPGAAVIARSVYETTAHFTGPGADYEHPLDRLAVFGETDSPALQYLGVSRGGEYAIFLLGPAATAAAGEVGACVVADPCRAIGLRRGEKLSVEVSDPGVAARHYTLEVTSLRRVARASAAAARREREHVVKGGRAILRTITDDVPTAAALGQLRYGPATGTVTLTGTR